MSEESQLNLKLGLDIHGVIDSKVDFFKKLTQNLRLMNEIMACKHEVHILTGPPKDELKDGELDGIWYTHFFSIVDFHKAKGTPFEIHNGKVWMDDYNWDRTKGDYCREHNLDLMIDDSATYHHFFSTPFAQFHHRRIKRKEEARKKFEA